MLILILLAIPLGGVLLISTSIIHQNDEAEAEAEADKKPARHSYSEPNEQKARQLKLIALQASLVTLLVSMVIFTLHHESSNTYQFVQEYHELSYFNLYLGVDGLSLYFVLLTTIIMPVSLLSN